MAPKRPPRTLGPGHDTFWQWCSKGELRLQHCTQCGNLTWPVRQTCEFCGSDALEWRQMSGKGKVVSWCSFDQDYYGGLLERPYDCILVELEEGPLFMSNPLDFGWADIAPDLPVQLAFLDCEDDAGAFRLPVFERMG